jgi:hypothetical protein
MYESSYDFIVDFHSQTTVSFMQLWEGPIGFFLMKGLDTSPPHYLFSIFRICFVIWFWMLFSAYVFLPLEGGRGDTRRQTDGRQGTNWLKCRYVMFDHDDAVIPLDFIVEVEEEK